MDSNALFRRPRALENSEFQTLLAAVRAGSDAAFARLVSHLSPAILAVIDRRVLRPDDPLRRQIDSCDLLHEGWKALIVAICKGMVFVDEHAMVAYAVTAAMHRCS